MEGQLTWERWHRVDRGIEMATEATLEAGVEPEYVGGVVVPANLPENMIYRARRKPLKLLGKVFQEVTLGETSDRHYQPRVGSEPELEAEVRRLTLKKGVKNARWYRLVFYKRPISKSVRVRAWCGRFGAEERGPFGFDTKGSSNLYYQPLSYPGKSGRFEPLFIKVAEDGEAPYYLKVEAHDEDGDVVVVAVSRVEAEVVPAFLREQN